MTDGKGSSVGYRRPPRHTQFKPGQSGNPSGSKKSQVDAAASGNADANMAQSAKPPQMGAFEVALRKLVHRALNDNDFTAVREVLAICAKYKVIKPPAAGDRKGTTK